MQRNTPEKRAKPASRGNAGCGITRPGQGALRTQEREAKREMGAVARTSISLQIEDEFDFASINSAGCISVLVGVKGRRWKAGAPELRTSALVEVPSSNDDRSFFAKVAESASGWRESAYNSLQIKLRVEEVLRESGLMLVLDEAHFLIPQFERPRGIPSRLQWLMSAFNTGKTAIAMIGLPDFSKWQNFTAGKRWWSDAQLKRI